MKYRMAALGDNNHTKINICVKLGQLQSKRERRQIERQRIYKKYILFNINCSYYDLIILIMMGKSKILN